MSDQDTSQGGFPLASSLTVLIALITGYIFIEPAMLNSERPDQYTLALNRTYSPEDVQARLWQDPFLAAQQHISSSPAHQAASPISVRATLATDNQHKQVVAEGEISRKALPVQGIHSLDALKKGIATEYAESGSPVRILAVMISAGPYAEESEQRLRRRYAVISALATSDYQPEDAEHIGFVRTPAQAGDYEDALPSVIPYEWYEPRQGGKHILLIWLDEGAFAHQPLVKLGRLSQLIKQDTTPMISDISIIGPGSSGTLKAMQADLKRLSEAHIESVTPDKREHLKLQLHDMNNLQKQVSFYSAIATVAESELGIPAGQSLKSHFLEAGIRFNRTIATDAQLADSLVDEMDMRISPLLNISGRHPYFHLAIVSEWDTLYGRSLPRALVNKLCTHYNIKNCTGFQHSHVHQFSYMRGIDGQVAHTDKRNETEQAEQTDKQASSVERPAGEGQKDYLRRLASQMSKTDQQLKNGGNRGIRAIGILGSDIYDKLMILQVLRERFPKALFFTTDLDANLIHPDNIPWTRNMIVASSFDLRLNDKIQRSMPPFRDSYQTSAHLAALIAVNSHITDLFEKNNFRMRPEVYEIGRSGFELLGDKPPHQDGVVSLTPNKNSAMSAKDIALTGCLVALLLLLAFIFWKQWNNDQTSTDTSLRNESTASILTLIFLFVLYLAWKHLLTDNPLGMLIMVVLSISVIMASYAAIMRFIRHEHQPDSAHCKSAFTFKGLAYAKRISHDYMDGSIWLCIAIITIFPLLVLISDEPFSLTSGTSIWPSEMLRLMAFWLSFVLLNHGWEQLKSNSRQIESELGISHEEMSTPEHHINTLWKRYHDHGSRFARFKRVMLQSFVWSGICLTLFLFETPNIPYRGDVAHWADLVISGLASTGFIIMFVFLVDAALYCRNMIIKPIHEHRMQWPLKKKSEIDLLDELKCEWWNIKLIGLRTSVVSRTVLYPIYLILLLLASQSTVFDNWSIPLSLVLIASINIALVLLTAILLRREAFKVKKRALENLDNLEEQIPDRLTQAITNKKSLLEHPSADQGTTTGQYSADEIAAILSEQRNTWETLILKELELMRKRINATRSGAFMPVTSQPWLKALTLFSGGGGLLLMDYLSRIN